MELAPPGHTIEPFPLWGLATFAGPEWKQNPQPAGFTHLFQVLLPTWGSARK